MRSNRPTLNESHKLTRSSIFASSLRIAFLLLSLLIPIHSPQAAYTELQTGFGIIQTPDQFFNTTNAGSTGLGFSGGLHFYFEPLQSKFLSWHIGLANRLTLGTSSNTSQALAMGSHHIATRLEFGRFFIGGGYAPFTWAGTDGITSLKPNSGASSYFLEAGAIWRVVPEFFICAVVSYEFGMPASLAINPSSAIASEYGLRFRFPLSIGRERKQDFEWDGWRYPFGVMAD